MELVPYALLSSFVLQYLWEFMLTLGFFLLRDMSLVEAKATGSAYDFRRQTVQKQ